jgi:hypothetical protein
MLPLGYSLMNLNFSYSRTSHLWWPMRHSAATLLDVVVDLISRTEAISSILDLFRSESGATYSHIAKVIDAALKELEEPEE